MLTALAVLGLGGAGLAAVAAAPASAATSCQVAYTANSWSTGFTASITITNAGSALTAWTLTYSYAGNQTLTQGWSGNWTQSGPNVTVTNASWNGSLATGASTQIGANFSYSGTNTAPTAFAINGTACNGSGSPSPSPSPSSSPTGSPTTSPSPSTSPTASPSPSPTSSGGGSCASGVSLQANPASFSVAQGTSGVFGVSLSASPTTPITVSVANTSGNSGLSVSAGSSITLSSSDWNLPQPVTVAANSSGTGAATFTVSAPGCTSVTVTGTETAAGSGTTPTHVANPFTGASWYVNPNYTSEVAASVAGASGTLAAQMTLVGQQPTGIWLDRIAAIYGGSGNSNRLSLAAQLANAASSSSPVIVPIVIYDLPNRDCAALASNGELTVANNGLQYYEQAYINPIAQILTDYSRTNIRVVAIIEPDSLPNLVTNLADANCAQANSSGAYVTGVQYALNKLHAIPNVYNYIDIAHSAWLGWSSNMGPAVSLIHTVAAGTTAGVASVDGFISDTANTTPISEPFMTATESIGGVPVDNANFYQFNPYIDELTYDEAMYSNFVSAGFSANIGMLIDTSRNGWGGPNRPTAASTSTVLNTFVNATKVDRRPFRGDWCNQNGAGLGPLPQANPNSAFTHLYAYVWIKPPGESDGDYPSGTHTHGDPHCDPNGTNTDGNGNTYPTNAIPGYDIPAGQWFPAQFTQLVQNAFPVVP